MISVIVPVYNGAEFIAEAIESILVQQTRDIEIIIVDDGSTDTTRQIVAGLNRPNITYLYQENAGPSRARNTGVRAARGNLIAFLDADDLWPKNKLKLQTEFLNHHPDVEIVGGLIEYVYMPGSEYRKEQLKIDAPVFNVQLGGLVVRKEVFEKIGFFNEALRFSEDQDWLLRVKELSLKIMILQEVVLLYRIHPGNITLHKTLKDLGVLKALKLSMDRRRTNAPTQPTNEAKN